MISPTDLHRAALVFLGFAIGVGFAVPVIVLLNLGMAWLSDKWSKQ